MGGMVVFIDGNIHYALDTLVFPELQICPLPFIDKVCQGFLQILEHIDLCTLYLLVIYIDFGFDFLGIDKGGCAQSQDSYDEKPDCSHK